MTKAKVFTIVKASLIAITILGAQACVEDHYYPAYGGGGYPAYGYDSPAVIGDYDQHHTFHDRDWWVGHDRNWVQVHHKEWLGEHHDGDHSDAHHDHDDHH